MYDDNSDLLMSVFFSSMVTLLLCTKHFPSGTNLLRAHDDMKTVAISKRMIWSFFQDIAAYFFAKIVISSETTVFWGKVVFTVSNELQPVLQ